MPIYTKTGDKGETALFGGVRVLKSEELIDVYGSMDELNSWVGLIISQIPHEEKKEFLTKIQADLFVLGGFLAGWQTSLSGLSSRVTEMEVEIDTMDKDLTPLNSFILPGGTELSSTVHITRSICRRVERQTVGLFSRQSSVVSLKSEDKEIILQYLNRLSDLFFTLARFINRRAGVEDTPWIGIERKK
jgi:cob(I)alamin adenosyltransferase